MAAYLSFSDVLTDYGSPEIYVAIAHDAAQKASEPEAMPPSIDVICVADPASYHT